MCETSGGSLVAECPVIPAPARWEALPGEPFVLRSGLRVVAGTEPEQVALAILVADRVGTACGFPVAVVPDDDGAPGAIVLRVVADLETLGLDDVAPALAAEAYALEVTSDRVTVTALAPAGLLRGAVTLQQLARPLGPTSSFQPCRVLDRPRFAWRGLSLDVARHFRTVDEVKAVLSVMTTYKLNVLHLHLTDDQGWRLALSSRPALAELSGGTAVGGEGGGFYTAADYQEIVTYAAARHITVVPEIDVPGHVNAALHAYGELTPSGRPTAEYTGVDVGFSRLHADLPATEPFLRDVFGEVASMTPGPWVHVGGDEVLTMDAEEYATLVRAAARAVMAAGKGVVGWQEIASALPDGVPGDVVVQLWDTREPADAVVEAARRGARVVLSPADRVYLDMKYDAATPVGLEWAGHVELRDAYAWEPADVLPGLPADRLLGVEAAIWSETVRTADDLFYLLLPRLAAVAEVAWSTLEARGWEGFAARVAQHPAVWAQAGLAWYPSPQVAWARQAVRR